MQKGNDGKPLTYVCYITVLLAAANIFLTAAGYRGASVVFSIGILVLAFFPAMNAMKGGYRGCEDCGPLKAERESAATSLKSHLSEQRHDFFNLLQVLYGYTQLKKPEKVLAQIKDYCSKMENIGRLYNSKCIKLADLLYTKEKESGTMDVGFEVSVEIGFEPSVRLLDQDEIVYAVDSVISNYFYMLNREGIGRGTVIYELKENTGDFRMDVYCREIKEGSLAAVPFVNVEEDFYWKKISRSIPSYDSIKRHCEALGISVLMDSGTSTFSMVIHKQ